MVDAFGSQRNVVKPPERGVFALDHDQECRPSMVLYLSCLKGNRQDHLNCRDQAKSYLECRMKYGLMREESLANLGFDPPDLGQTTSVNSNTNNINEDYKNQSQSSNPSQTNQGSEPNPNKTSNISSDLDRVEIDPKDSRETKGFMAGTGVKASNKWKLWGSTRSSNGH